MDSSKMTSMLRMRRLVGGWRNSCAGAIGRWNEDERLAPPNTKAGSVGLGLGPEFCGGGGGMLRVGAEIEEEGGIEEGIAPERGRGGGVSNKATNNLGDLTNATLSDAVLLRGVGEGGGLLNAVCFAVSGKGMIDELTPTVRVKAADGAFEVSATLLSPVDDHNRHLVFRVKKEDGGVPIVVINEDEHARGNGGAKFSEVVMAESVMQEHCRVGEGSRGGGERGGGRGGGGGGYRRVRGRGRGRGKGTGGSTGTGGDVTE
ncbi:unnamed protein product [Closterium sp. NIES-54]